MGEAMRKHRDRVAVSVAVSCVGPLTETVLAADIAVVDAAEYRRACSVLAELTMLDPLRMCAEYMRRERFATVWKSSGSALHAVFRKDPAELTREDALTVAEEFVMAAIVMARGFDDLTAVAGIEFLDWFGVWPAHPANNQGGSSEAVLERVNLLLLELARDPQGASDLTLGGAWFALCMSLSGRAVLAVPLIEAGLLEAAVATLHRSSPVEWVTWTTPTGIIGASIVCLAWTLSTLEG